MAFKSITGCLKRDSVLATSTLKSRGEVASTRTGKWVMGLDSPLVNKNLTCKYWVPSSRSVNSARRSKPSDLGPGSLELLPLTTRLTPIASAGKFHSATKVRLRYHWRESG